MKHFLRLLYVAILSTAPAAYSAQPKHVQATLPPNQWVRKYKGKNERLNIELYRAVLQGNVAQARLLLSAAAHAQHLDLPYNRYRPSPLHLVFTRKNDALMELFLDYAKKHPKVIDLNTTLSVDYKGCPEGASLGHIAIQKGNIAGLKRLISFAVQNPGRLDLNALAFCRYSPALTTWLGILHLAARHPDTIYFRTLVEAIKKHPWLMNPNIQVITGALRGATPLYCIVDDSERSVADKLQMLQWLKDCPGLNPCIGLSNGQTPLHRAVISGEKEVVSLLLLIAPALRDAQNQDKAIPLSLACSKNKLAIASLLLEAGADTELFAGPSLSWTPIGRAVLNKNLPLITLFLAHAAKRSARLDTPAMLKNWVNPFQLAVILGHTPMVGLFLDFAAQYDLLDLNIPLACKFIECSAGALPGHIAIQRGNVELLNQLVKFGLKHPDKLNLKAMAPSSGDDKLSQEAMTLLHLAVLQPKTIYIHTLVEVLQQHPKLLNVNAQLQGHGALAGATAFYLAVQALTPEPEKLQILERLQKCPGLDPCIGLSDGQTPLHRAVMSGEKDVVSLLLLIAPALRDAKDKYEATPLSLACVKNNLAMVNLLLNNGAKPEADRLQWAALLGHFHVVAALVEAGRKQQLNLFDYSQEFVDFLRRVLDPPSWRCEEVAGAADAVLSLLCYKDMHERGILDLLCGFTEFVDPAESTKNIDPIIRKVLIYVLNYHTDSLSPAVVHKLLEEILIWDSAGTRTVLPMEVVRMLNQYVFPNVQARKPTREWLKNRFFSGEGRALEAVEFGRFSEYLIG